jgi:hypothetical protein
VVHRFARPVLLLVVVAAGAAVPLARAHAAAPPACTPGGATVVMAGSVAPADAKTYLDLPFRVGSGTTRVEVGYSWLDNTPLPDTPANQLIQTVFDLGLWDEGGIGTPAGFRGWSGSRQGKIAATQPQAPIWVQADNAERGYRPGTVKPGTWNVDLGIAAVSPGGATWRVEVRCLAPSVGPPFKPTPVNAKHVANKKAGWYFGDFHMHGRHSNPKAPDWNGWVEYARAAGLSFLPMTDYVTDQGQRELGPIQKANPDLVIWPGREVITYFGHATVFGETPHVVDWRHGAPGVSLRDIQDKTVADGALFGVAHPTIFPTPVFASFCRGCEFTLGNVIDWDKVSTIEVLTGPELVDNTQIGGPPLGPQIQNPFVPTAIDLWHKLLREGHKITAVSGSDDKLGPGLGSSATAVYADQLSRAALARAVKAGHAYVRTLGVHHSPTLEMVGVTPDGQRGIFGDVLHAESAAVTVKVRGGNGQLLLISRDGLPAGAVPVTSDDFTHTFDATRIATSGPLGTFWRVDTLRPADGLAAAHLTTIGNPIFLTGPAAPTSGTADGAGANGNTRGGELPATGAEPMPLLVGLVVAASLVVRRLAPRQLAAR